MRIENVDIDVILGTENKGIYGAHEKEKKGFFKKLFDKEDAQEEYFKDRVQEIGRGELEKELSGEIDAYLVEKADPKNTVILTENYFILPGKELFPLYMIKEFALGSEWMPPYQQYAADRFGIPYDPDYKSEYEDEEGFELDRFNVEFIIHEEENGVIIHSFPMEIFSTDASPTIFPTKVFSKENSTKKNRSGNCSTDPSQNMTSRFSDRP